MKKNKWIDKIISALYPVHMKASQITGVGQKIFRNETNATPPQSFYSLRMVTNTGQEISFERYRGKNIIVVNVASKCGFTPQYTALERLYQNTENLEILGFPSNDFGNQEPDDDPAIRDFCELNYGVSFTLFQKSIVSGTYKNEVYDWLTDPRKNGWNSQAPGWNFYKYYIDSAGKLKAVASSSVAPQSVLPEMK